MAACVFCAAIHLRGETVALWLFDEERGAQSVLGKFGRAFQPSAGEPEPGAPPSSAAARHRGNLRPKLNVGDGDWTLECWLKLAVMAAADGVVFEIGDDPRGPDDCVTRLSVLPAENAFALVSLTAAPKGVAKRVERPNPAGPPARAAWRESTTLALNGDALPRATWFHVAVVHDAAAGALRLFIGGRLRAVAAVQMMALPPSADGYFSIGRDGQGQRPIPGAIDELRVSDHVVYREEFAPPGSFSAAPKP